ncbi:GNAT family N-acetyltransferase, partial [uncultured Duncaniella sp.]|uniref:GNAT family N-acetyltransferase n=1 Tax=uncultured Duncaniella sp. TaxID=2768039 RepID=UPI002677419A
MKIREVRTDDAKEIAEIYNHYVRTSTVTFDTVIATEEMTRNRIEAIASRYPYYVCEDEGRVVGYAYAHEWKGRGAYHNTLEASAYVLDGMTGRGGDDDYYILTLAAIARELNVHGLTDATVRLAVGLPLTWVSQQRE